MVDILSLLVITGGLILFEIITSIDNAIINAEVLSTMSKRARQWFLLWGIIIAVFLVRGLLPFAIFWAANPYLNIQELFTAALSSDPRIVESVEQSAPILLAGGGIFLVFLFFHWLFLEDKHYGLRGERFVRRQGVWFYAIVSIILTGVVWLALHTNPFMAFGAVVGSTVFFITHGFKENAAHMEQKLMKGNKASDVSKVLYLEAIDMTFSIDGVLGAFAFTLLVPLILIGNGIGAIVVRQMTVRNIERVRKYVYLKNGAMYSVLALGTIMLLDAFGIHVPHWLAPAATFAIVGYFFIRSIREVRKHESSSVSRSA